MFELFVPAEKKQLIRLEGEKQRYDVELRPKLMQEVIGNLRGSGC